MIIENGEENFEDKNFMSDEVAEFDLRNYNGPCNDEELEKAKEVVVKAYEGNLSGNGVKEIADIQEQYEKYKKALEFIESLQK